MHSLSPHDHYEFETSALDEDAGTTGAIALAQQHVLKPAGVAKLLDAQRFPND